MSDKLYPPLARELPPMPKPPEPPPKPPETEFERTTRFLLRLLKNVGEDGQCAWCKRRILWVRHVTGRAAPYDPDGETHFATCEHYPNRKGANPNGR